MAAKKLCVGVIAGAHGVRGEVRVKSFTADPDALVDYGPFTDEKGNTEYVFEVTGRSRGMILGRVNGVKDRDLADAQRGTELYIDRDMLPQAEEDEFYYADLVGLAVVLEDGSAFGVVRAVQEYGAGDMIEIALSDGQTTILPFTRAIFPTIDLAAGRLVAVVPEDTYATSEHMGSDHADGETRETDETEKEPS